MKFLSKYLIGGFIDLTDESWEHGLNRELNEELNINSVHLLDKKNHFFSSVNSERKLVLHFYTYEVSDEIFRQIELDSMHSQDFGGEVMGIIRPPLFETSRERGLSTFINHQFIGTALIQFLRAIVHLKILPNDRILRALDNAK